MKAPGVRWVPGLVGVAATLTVVAVVEWLQRTPVAVPDPTALFLLAIASAALVGGLGVGLLCAGISVAYLMLLFLGTGYGPDELWHVVMVALAGPLMAVLVGSLAKRARRASEWELSRARDFSSAVIASLQDGLIVRDAAGRIIEVNDSFCRMTGFSRDDLLGTTAPYPHWPREELDRINLVFDRFRQETANEVELVFQRKSGERFPVLLSGSVLKVGGASRGFVVTVKDITERKRADQTMRQLMQQLDAQRQRMDEVVANVPGVVWELSGRPGDPESRITFVSRYVEKMLGYGAQECLGRLDLLVDRLVHPEDREHVRVQTERIFAGEAEGSVQFRWVTREGGALWVETQCAVIHDSRGEAVGLRGVTMDITRRRETQQELQRRADELAQMTTALEGKNRELDQFAYIASHDLKAPLRGIANLSQWIEEDSSDKLPPEARQQLELLQGRVHRMEALIDGILQYSRIGRVHFKPEPVDMSRLLAEIVEMLDPPSPFTIEVRPGMPTLVTEKVHLQQVFLNLMGNAIKHHDREDGRVTVSVKELGEMYEFAVSDDGPGIGPQYHEKIFMIFQTLMSHDTVEGTGLGLSLVKKIVESQGGRITVESQEGRGSTFRFTWPKQISDQT